jgi:YidC/Oxa1 family membrane protein insertase
MDRKRLIMALALSLVVLMSWPLIMRYLAPTAFEEPIQLDETALQSPADKPQEVPGAGTKKITPVAPSTAQPQTQTQTTQVGQRDVTIAFVDGNSEYWRAKLSNRGVVATSWILYRYSEDGDDRTITGADGNPLELIPKQIPEPLSAPLSLRTPWLPEIGQQLNQVNFQIEGLGPSENEVTLGPNESRTITFKYTSPSVTATKSFTFHGGSFVFDVTAEVMTGGSEQAVELVLGPRIGDQSDKQTSSYTTPPSVVGFTRDGERQQIPGVAITPPFATVTVVDPDSKRIELDKPLADGIAEIKLTADDGATLIGYARVTNREANGQRLTLEALPPGTSKGNGVAQGVDTIRHLYGWAGVSDHYFAMLAVPDPNQAIPQITLTNIQIKDGETPLDYPSAAIPIVPTSKLHIFVGPKDRQLLGSVGQELGANLDALIDYGLFSFAVKPLIPALAWGLNGFRKMFGNYGWAIVAVTVLINLALSPLRFYSSKKMKKAAKHQPRMKELQDRMKKLKENPKKYERELQELQQEQLALMKEANPLGGCMPLLLQMPIFWAVYLYLGSSLDVRHAPWILWIKDLSIPDPLKILPIVMCVTMIASTKLTPQPISADPSMKMQRIMMTWLMPIMLTWLFFFSAPSGLVLYWMVSNLVGVLIQLWINRMTADLTAEIAAAAAASGGGSKGTTRRVDKPGTQKRPKDKNGKRRQEGRGGAEEVA